MAMKMAEMKTASPRPIDAPAWLALQANYEKIKDVHLRRLFAEDPKRGTRLTAEGADLFLDYSKNRVTDETIGLLLQLARERGVAERRDAMFRGEKINITGTARFCTWPCVRRAEPRSRWMAKT